MLTVTTLGFTLVFFGLNSGRTKTATEYVAFLNLKDPSDVFKKARRLGKRVTPGDFSRLVVSSIVNLGLEDSAQPTVFNMANGSPPFRRLAAGSKIARSLRNVRPARALIAGHDRVSVKQNDKAYSD